MTPRKRLVWWGLSGCVTALLVALAVVTTPPDVVLPSASNYRSSEASLLDRHGTELARLRLDDSARRIEWSPLAAISPALQQAVIAAEDQRFYRHGGVDGLALLAAVKDGLLQRGWRGASTVSMQLAGFLHADLIVNRQQLNKHLWFTGKRTSLQKIKQVRSAWALERQYPKAELLEAYLNSVTFRGEQQGIASAAWTLFGKAPVGLNANESALLAALIRAPQARPAVVARRACAIVQALESPQANCAVLAQLAEALRRPNGAANASLAPYQASHLARQLLSAPGERFISSLDAAAQRYTVQSLAEHLREITARNVEDGAVVVLDNATGAVLAYVGSSGRLSQAAQVDAARALRQAGSTLKPFLYGLALDEKRITAASLLHDSPVAIQTDDGQFSPRNYSNDFKGWVSARHALAASLNVPAVRTLAMMDLELFTNTLRKAGLASVTQNGDFYGHSLALGSADVRLLELTNAYRTLANGGLQTPVVFTPNALNNVAKPVRALSKQAAYIVGDMLSDNEARSLSFGLDNPLRLPFWAAVKTGTSKDMRDNWCIGYSARFTVGVWVGNASGAAMHDVSGVHGAAPIWHDVMRYLHQRWQGSIASNAPVMPAGLTAQAVRFVGVSEAARREVFLSGTERASIELASLGEAAESADTAQNSVPKITQPLNGAVYALDPDIPQSAQRLTLARTNGQATWLLNGLVLGYQQRLPWPLAPGRHVLALRSANGRVADEVRFEVRVPARVVSSQGAARLGS